MRDECVTSQVQDGRSDAAAASPHMPWSPALWCCADVRAAMRQN